MRVLRIKSSGDGTVLELRPHDQDYFVAAVIGRNINAHARVGRYMAEGLGDLFAYLSTNWKGWKGERKWESLEGEFRLSATSDLTGHITLNVHLHDGAPVRWEVDTFLELEAGQLQGLADEVKVFEREVVSAV